MGSATDLILSADRRVVRKAWELFVTGDNRYLEKVRPDIRESWLRSRQAGVDPAMRQLPNVLKPEELECKYRKNTHLLEAGRMATALLVKKSKTFIVNIVDSEGTLLHSSPPSHKSDKREEVNGFPGAGFGENLVGTTSPGLALCLDRPIQVQWYEYYAELGHNWVGFAAPVHNCGGGVLGTLSIARYTEAASPQVLDAVAAAAEFMERYLKDFEKLAHLTVLEEFNRYLLKFPESPILALCPHGRLLAFSPPMAKLVTLQPPDRLIGQRLRDVRDFQFAAPFPPSAGRLSEPYESSIAFPHKQKVCTGTVVPVQSKEGERSGMVVIVSGFSQSAHKRVTEPLWQATYTFHDLIGCAPAFQRSLHLARKAAEYDRPVLLSGETGTGKELFAQAIHRASRRAPGPFVAINCSVIPKELLASELFGYEEGAFSGALRGGKRGKIEIAHRGTLFLDELGDIPAEVQLGFLRFLEEGRIVPLGSEHSKAVDVRIIAAMNLDPLEAVAQGKLRPDLYHRLNQLPVFLPPLRERVADLPTLIRYLLEREGFPHREVAPEAMAVLCQYPWPGNVRELRNILARAAIFSSHRVITREALPPELLTKKPLVAFPQASSPPIDRERILRALQECGGNISRAAQCLGIHRVTLHHKLRTCGLTRETLAIRRSSRMLEHAKV